VRRQIAALYEQAASLRALGYKGFASFAQGSSAPEHSYMKMATSELGKAAYELGMQLQGADGPTMDPDRGEDNGRWVHMFFMSFANTIAGGSSEIQRNIIAQRVLGLPRA
jgi:alkylation response protein AidB-like acyl-CoA dehydrogenase